MAIENKGKQEMRPRYKQQSSDTVASTRHIPYFNYMDTEDFVKHRPMYADVFTIEITDKAWNLVNFAHPKQALYMLGSEGGGISKELLSLFPSIQIPSRNCLNLATAGSIVMYDRIAKGK